MLTLPSNKNSNQALIDIGGGLTVQGTGSLTVKINSTRNAPIIGSDSNENSNANITLINANITVNDNVGAYSNATLQSIGAGANGSIGNIIKDFEEVPITPVTLKGEPTFNLPKATVVNGENVTLTDSGTFTVDEPTVVTDTIQHTVTYTVAGEHTVKPPPPAETTVVSGEDVTLTGYTLTTVETTVTVTDSVTVGGITVKGEHTVKPPPPAETTVVNGTTVTLTDYETFTVDEPTDSMRPDTITYTVAGEQSFDTPKATVMNGEDVTLTNYEIETIDVPTTLTDTVEVSITVSETLEGVQTFNLPLSTVMNGEDVTLTKSDTFTVNVTKDTMRPDTVAVDVETVRPVTINVYDTQEASRTITIPVYGTETYEYEILADLLKNPLKIHHGTKANQRIQLYIDDLRTKALGTSDLLDENGNFLKAEDEDLYWALSYDKKKREAYLETLKAAQNKSLDDIDVKTKDHASISIRVLDGTLDTALLESVRMGAYLQRLEYTGANIITMSEKIQSAESVIRDADMAKEMTNYTKYNVLAQAAQSMLAQANRNSSTVLDLLQ